jgi:hypothetical protein
MITPQAQAKLRPGVSADEEEGSSALLRPGQTFESVTEQISDIILKHRHPIHWWVSFGLAFLLTMGLFYAIAILLAVGVGIWGINIPVAWGFAITNFVWWIGIGHAGTLISAILLLLMQKWRNSINRLAEAMTLFAVACAGMFPLLHLGRPWAFFWLLPYPNGMELWPQFRSALVWDVFAVSTYFTVSVFFWYTGLVPDAATLRDRARHRTTKNDKRRQFRRERVRQLQGHLHLLESARLRDPDILVVDPVLRVLAEINYRAHGLRIRGARVHRQDENQ